jgi:hypothetical protein
MGLATFNGCRKNLLEKADKSWKKDIISLIIASLGIHNFNKNQGLDDLKECFVTLGSASTKINHTET